MKITIPANVQIVNVTPAPESKAAAAIREREVIAAVLRAVNVAYYMGVLS